MNGYILCLEMAKASATRVPQYNLSMHKFVSVGYRDKLTIRTQCLVGQYIPRHMIQIRIYYINSNQFASFLIVKCRACSYNIIQDQVPDKFRL